MVLINFLDFILMFLLFYTLISLILINELGETRIIVFFIYFEVIQVLIILIVLTGLTYNFQHTPIYLIIVLFIIGSAGAETAIIIALFISYVKNTGLSTFQVDKKQKENKTLASKAYDSTVRIFPLKKYYG